MRQSIRPCKWRTEWRWCRSRCKGAGRRWFLRGGGPQISVCNASYGSSMPARPLFEPSNQHCCRPYRRPPPPPPHPPPPPPALTSFRCRQRRRRCCSTGQQGSCWQCTQGWSTRVRQSIRPCKWRTEWRWCRSHCTGGGRRWMGRGNQRQCASPPAGSSAPRTASARAQQLALLLAPPQVSPTHQFPVQPAQAVPVQYWLAPHCCRAGG